MDKKNSERQRSQRSKKQQKTIYKGIYISNQRRKGTGGRIKSDVFNCKIQVNDFNPALHQSQVQWIQIRRYKKGRKLDNKQKDQNKNFNKNFNKNLKPNNNNKVQQTNKKQSKYKQKQTQDEKKQKDSLQHNVIEKINQPHSQPAIHLNEQRTTDIVNNNQDNNYVKSQTSSIKEQKKVKNQSLQQNFDKRQLEQRLDQQQTESLDEQDIQERREQEIHQNSIKQQSLSMKDNSKQVNENNQLKKVMSDIIEKQKQKQQQQEVIVARIIKQTKILCKQKKFVAILTCEKKKNSKQNYIEKDIKPIQKIMQDYYLDVTPIHSRLPKMELDNLVKGNIRILSEYIQKVHPQKGKELTKKKLNGILDIIQSIYVVASFNLWQGSRPYANIHQIIGKTMTIDGQCNCFLYQHSLNDFHYQQIPNEGEQIIKKQITLSPTQKHTKYQKMVFSIDPATSIDLDDALSIQKIDENHFQVGIHISDVSEYLDYISRQELMKRTTSVYLPHKVFHMLTYDLMKISSLNPNIQRLAFSVFVKMNLDGNIVGESRLQKNIIQSRFKLSYQTVQDIISAKIFYKDFIIKHPDTSVEQFDILVEKLQNLTLIGLAHRGKRIKFQVFQNRQISFQLDKQRWPIQISVESRYTSKKIVEEYMIIGNVEAAKHLIKNFKQNSLIIYHPKPSELSVKNFNQTFKFLQLKFQFDDILQIQEKFLQIQKSKDIPQSVKQYLYFKGRRMQQTAGYKLYHEAIKQITDKQIQKKQQILIKNVHFALGQDFYTHFTSPMRRMADVIVHETLNSVLYNTEPKKILPEQIQKINQGRKHTKRLKKDLTQIYMCLMIHKTKKCIKQDGIITSFGLKSVSIYIPYFDMMKQIIWKDQLQIDRVTKNRQNQNQLDVCIYYDKKYPPKDIYWKVKKYDTVKLIIDCTRRPPLRLAISIEVTTIKDKKQIIHAYNPQF